jgi:hypothetical protein
MAEHTVQFSQSETREAGLWCTTTPLPASGGETRPRPGEKRLWSRLDRAGEHQGAQLPGWRYPDLTDHAEYLVHIVSITMRAGDALGGWVAA